MANKWWVIEEGELHNALRRAAAAGSLPDRPEIEVIAATHMVELLANSRVEEVPPDA